MVFSYGETLPLPEPLLEELLALCNRYDGDLEPMSSLSFETDTRILLSGKKDHWEIFRGDHPLLSKRRWSAREREGGDFMGHTSSRMF